MKRIRIAALTAALALILAGCGSGAPEVPEEELRGSWDGNTYTNAFLGLCYRMPESWTRLDDGELDAMDEGTVVTVLSATAEFGDKNCLVLVEKLNAIQAAMDEEAYLDAYFEQTEGELADGGITDARVEKGAVVMAGRERPCLRWSGKRNGMELYQLTVLQKSGSYIAVFTFTTAGKNVTEKLLPAWTALPAD